MPELAEVAYHCSIWRQAAGERFSVAWVHENARCCRSLDAGRLKKRLDGLSLVDGYTHGKRMLFAFGDGVFLEAHLGMTGELLRLHTGEVEEGRHDHLALSGESSLLLFRDQRMFGKLALHESDSGRMPQWWLDLPPQPQERAFTRKRFSAMLEGRGKAVLKPLLLAQELFPGVGNWMADEILWRARLRPDRRLSSLSVEEREELYAQTKWVCREALKIVGKDYSDPPKSWLFPHRWKKGGTCPVSEKPLRHDTIGGRTTCWSPALQR